MSFIKKLYIYIYKAMFNFLYRSITLFTNTNENKAVFIVSRENKLQGNLQFVFVELKKIKPDIEIHFIQTENKMNLKLFKDLFLIGDAKYIILDDYYLPIYLVKPNKNLKVIQLWHAAGAFKKFGYSTIGTKFGPSEQYLRLVPVHSNYTHVYVSSKHVIKYYAKAFNIVHDKMYALGVPRTDIFFDKGYQEDIKRKLANKYPVVNNEEKINILIAPTYRANKGQQGESSLNMAEIIAEISPKLNSKIRILYKAHPYTSEVLIEKIKRCPNIYLINDYTLNDWMLVSDAFITDYSSAVFEFSLLNRPFAHFVPDLIDYEENRGFYEPMDQITSGDIIMDDIALIHWINQRRKNEYFNTNKMVNYNFSRKGSVTQDIVSHFINN